METGEEDEKEEGKGKLPIRGKVESVIKSRGGRPKNKWLSPVIDIHGYLGVSTDPTAAAATAAAAARG